MSGHLTRAQLEQLLAEDLRVPAALRVHAGSCDRCTVRRLALERARARYMSMHPAPEFARLVVERMHAQAPVSPRPRRMRYLAPLAGLAVVAAALVLWPRPAAIRTKGSSSLEVIVKRGAIQKPLAAGEGLAAGDRLAFAYSLDRPRYLLLIGVDASGEVRRYYSSQAPLAPTRRGQLPIGVELDGRKDDERVYALFSDAALDEASVRAAVRNGLDGGRGIEALDRLSLPPSISVFTVWYRKP